jgi:hypothetical protein
MPLRIEQLAFGVSELLALLADEQGLEARRPSAPPDGVVVISTLVDREFPDGVCFELRLVSPPRRRHESGLTMVWYGEGGPSLPPWRLDVDIEVCSYPWASPEDLPGFADFRKFRSILDEFAQPRLIVPATNAGAFQVDYMALLALFAVKAKCLAPTEDLVRQFRGYCSGLFQDMFDKRYRRRVGSQDGLPLEEWTGIVDKVFGRLYHGKAGRGFTMPSRPESFRAYVWQALRGEFARLWGRTRVAGNDTGFPQSVAAAAANLGVSEMTVHRRLKRLGQSAWSPEAWESVSGQVRLKKQWQEITQELERSGSKPAAARKKVQRWKKDGLTPGEALQRMKPTHPRGVCSACREEGAIGEQYRGKFLCAECLAEKLNETSS